MELDGVDEVHVSSVKHQAMRRGDAQKEHKIWYRIYMQFYWDENDGFGGIYNM